jgi:DNA recombination protein RmuC
MEITSIFIGLIAGALIAYFIFYLLHKTRSVSAAEYNSLQTKFQEATINGKLLEERLQNQFTANAVISQNLQDEKETVQLFQKDITLHKERLSALHANNNALTESLEASRQLNEKHAGQIDQLTATITHLTAQVSNLSANNLSLKEKLETQKNEIIEFRNTSQQEFENIANRLLKANTEEFTNSSKANMEGLLKPLSQDIATFKTKVEEETKERFSLGEKVKDLILQTNKVSEEANNLASALKGQSKKQGNWGEVILESILQKSGLVKEREYFVQHHIKDEEGKKMQPDILVKLPDNRMVIIDSKVSLLAYDRFSASDSAEEQKLHLSEHLRSIYCHVDGLSGKEYDNAETSLDFTMMFIPIEPAYLLAIQADQELWAYAYSKRILLISPTNLIACLKLITDLWKRELQSKNAMEIVKRGELLYDKFVSFTATLEDVGKHINRSQASYAVAIAQLNSGSGHLVGQALKLKSLGLKSSKEIPASLIGFEIDTEEMKDGSTEQR